MFYLLFPRNNLHLSNSDHRIPLLYRQFNIHKLIVNQQAQVVMQVSLFISCFWYALCMDGDFQHYKHAGLQYTIIY